MTLKDVTFGDLLTLFFKAIPALILAYVVWALLLFIPLFMLGFALGILGAIAR